MMRLNEAIEKWNSLEKETRLRIGYAVILLLALAMGWTSIADKISEKERKRQAREQTLKELLPLKAAYQAARNSHAALSGRISSVRPDDTVAKILEEIAIKGKGIKIAPLKGEERNGIQEDISEVRIEGVTVNEAVNLFYRLEKGGRPLIVRKANFRVRFDDPARLDLIFTAVLLKQPAGKGR